MMLRPDGAPEMTYGTNGVAKMTGRFFAGATMRASLSGGTATITAAGDDLRVYRITPSGTPDPTFGTNGMATARSFNGSVFRPTVQDNGALLLTFRDFTTPDQPQRKDRLLRFTPTGELDNGFGTNGVANLPASYQPVVLHGATIANDDSILVAGRASDGRMLVARFWGSEAPAVQAHTKNRRLGGAESHRLTITVRDDERVDLDSLRPPPLHVESPQGVSMQVTLIGIDARDPSGSVIGMNLKIGAPGGSWGPEDNGAYIVQLHGDGISDNEMNRATGRIIGTFWVHI
jgi:hypothetical protein